MNLLDACRWDFRGWEHHYLYTLFNSNSANFSRAHRLGHQRGLQPRRQTPGQRQRRNGTVKVWDAATGQETLTLKGHTGPVTSVAFSPDGKRLASAQRGQDGEGLGRGHGPGDPHPQGAHRPRSRSVAFSPDGKRLASASDDQTVKVWDAATGQETSDPQGAHRPVTSVVLQPRRQTPRQRQRWDETVKVWDAATGQETLTLKGHTDSVTSVAFSPDGKRLASASDWDKTVKVWDAADGPGDPHPQGAHRQRSPAWPSAPTANASPAPALTRR